MASIVSAVSRRLEGKVALITGGGRGIGEYTAKVFSKHGAKVVIADIQDQSAHPNYIHCDVTNEDDIRNAVDKTVSRYGKLDIMFNNAGIVDDPKPLITDNKKADFERVLNVNVTGVFLGMKHAARVMVPARSGSIISTSSICTGLGGMGTHAYTCSKTAVVGLTKNLAAELGQFGIRVNCLSPYVLASDMSLGYTGLNEAEFEVKLKSIANLQGPILKTEDVANAAVFLASDEAEYVSGQNLFIDGGYAIADPALKMLLN